MNIKCSDNKNKEEHNYLKKKMLNINVMCHAATSGNVL